MGFEGMSIVRVADWSRYKWLRHGFSTRLGGKSTVYSTDGDLNLGFTSQDDPDVVRQNRAAFVQAVSGGDATRMIALRQVHGTEVKLVWGGETGLQTEDGRAVVEADGLITAATGVMLAVQAADCVPVLVADVRLRVVGAFHAGWRGTAAGMVELGVGKMTAAFGCNPSDMIAAVGPAIGVCCYTVGDEVRGHFAARFEYSDELFVAGAAGLHVDLAEANRRQLIGSGLTAGSVAVVGECTACTRVGGRRTYFSHRAEHGFTGRAMGMIGVVAV